jgi:hypothetical protein
MTSLKLVAIIFILIIIIPGMAEERDLMVSSTDNHSDYNDQNETVHLIDIEIIHKNPNEFTDKFYEIDGVVSLVFSQKDQFILSEVKSCPICAYSQSPDNTILVNYLGKLPEKRENVRVYGFLKRDDHNQLQFNATVVKRK